MSNNGDNILSAKAFGGRKITQNEKDYTKSNKLLTMNDCLCTSVAQLGKMATWTYITWAYNIKERHNTM